MTFSSPNPHIKNPEYYLHRDFDKNYSFSGTPFIGAGADENSDAFVIYAHNMNNGTRIFEQNPSTSTNRTFTIVPSPESNCIGRWFLISDEPKLLFAGHSVTIGKATSIGKWAFEDCDSLRSVTILRRFVNSQKANTACLPLSPHDFIIAYSRSKPPYRYALI
ncbi:MAG: hypothetical protein IIV23_04655 [Ruminococcus sp.]|nr:hypothetical protein [Ruminococcus sp.]